MKKQETNTKNNKQLIDKLLENRLGKEYTDIVIGDSQGFSKCSDLTFMIQKKKMKKCEHIFLTEEFVDEKGQAQQVHFCIKCGLNTLYMYLNLPENLMKVPKEMYEIFKESDNDTFIKVNCHAEQLRLFYAQIKEILPGLTDEAFIQYLYATFGAEKIEHLNIKRKTYKK